MEDIEKGNREQAIGNSHEHHHEHHHEHEHEHHHHEHSLKEQLVKIVITVVLLVAAVLIVLEAFVGLSGALSLHRVRHLERGSRGFSSR